jgi:hypothetical protein
MSSRSTKKAEVGIPTLRSASIARAAAHDDDLDDDDRSSLDSEQLGGEARVLRAWLGAWLAGLTRPALSR